ncbi:MAG: peptidoglycan DD-metalloendopeptidase family protein [Oscillospiraceae bacterium]|jgi:murein DD-endopeptidase MepM/ murein hydrolase activator NlpD
MKKKSFAEGMEAFFTGKGFYIVLLLCIAVIGCSAWILFHGEPETEPSTDITLSTPEVSTDAAITEEEETADLESANVESTETETASMTEDSDVDAAEETIAESEAVETTVEETTDQFVWPCNGAVENTFSMDALVYNRTMADWRTHEGIDVCAELGEQVHAVASGTVERVYNDDLYGTTVVVSHGGGLTSTYSNLAEVPTVNEGDTVSAGDVIGAVGTTALCEAGEVNHLHLAMAQDGAAIDPCTYLPPR